MVATVSPESARAGVAFTALRPGPGGVLAGRRDGLVEWYGAKGAKGGSWGVFRDQEVTCLAWAVEGAEALVGGSKGGVARLSLAEGAVSGLGEMSHADAVVGLAVLAGGGALSASADQTVVLWDGEGQKVLTLREAGPIESASAAPGGGEVYAQVQGEWGVRGWDLAALRNGLLDLGLTPGYAVTAVRSGPAPAAAGLDVEVSSFHRSGGVVVERRRDAQVGLDLKDGAPVSWVRADGFSVRWTGWLRAPRPGPWELWLDADDEATLWVGGRAVLTQKRGPGGKTRPATATVELPAGRVSFRLDYAEITGEAHCRLRWRPAGSDEPFVPVPAGAFTPD